ncbi:hypothetical protein BH09CHL1_BH09CHL1_28960 [soil metagenome]
MEKPGRFIGLIVVLLGMLVGGIAPEVNAQNSAATLTIHSRFCPPDYDGTDIFVDCHSNPGLLAIDYSISGEFGTETAMPDFEGNLTFTDLTPGIYRVDSSLPVDGQHPAIYCSPGDGSAATYYKADSTRDFYSFRIELAAGDNIVCDWYTLPDTDVLTETANLIVHNRFCPVGYNGNDEFADCHGNIGISYVDYTLGGANERSSMLDEGNAYFYWLNPGLDRLTFAYDSFDLPASVSCSIFGTGEEPFLIKPVDTGDALEIDLAAGDTVVCDWYIYPTSDYYEATTPMPVFVASCPTDPGGFAQGDLPAQCDTVAGVHVIAYPTAGGLDYADECVTDANGGCKVDVPAQVPLTVEIDTDSLPAGYIPLENPVHTLNYTEFAEARIILVPAAEDKGD